MERDYLYPVVDVHTVIDGDTVEMTIDLGCNVLMRDRFRVLGIDAPEKRGAEKEAGIAATEFAERWFDDRIDAQEIWVRTHKDKKGGFGRWLAEIVDEFGSSFGNAMLESGHAVEYDR